VNSAQIHLTAVVESDVLLGDGVAVWHHAHVRAGARIGEATVLGKNVFVDAGVTIGARCKVQNNVSVYRGVTLADEVFVGPSAVFTNDRYPRAVSPDWEVVATMVETGASIGANATIVCGVTLGAWSVVAAGAVVTRSVEPYQLVAGTPARHLGWVCRHGRVVSRAAEPPVSFQACSCVDAP
jgi:acetyltransferase-like isoleucine patch superfamily enzyme